MEDAPRRREERGWKGAVHRWKARTGPISPAGVSAGAVRYRVADAFLYAANCHCSRCRAATGSEFKAFAGVERDKLQLTAGADALLVVGEDDQHDARCPVLRFAAVLRRARGCLRARGHGVAGRRAFGRPTAHIFVASTAPWFEITDELPQFEAYPDP